MCYEVIHSNVVAANSVSENLIIVQTSEYFMNNSYFGQLQYDNIIKLRAIENKKTVVKISNGGNSYLTSLKGKLLYNINFFEVINVPIHLNEQSTYSSYFD